jgi:prolyl-tRNA editing enzyme YbaK/EbsC (Cys-tRNA(Pro) deacylase)
MSATEHNLARMTTYLQTQGLPGEIVHLSTHTPTVEDAARAVGTPVDRIIKSVLFLADGVPVLVIANGTARVDHKRVADYLKVSRKRVKLADAATVLAITGFEVGTVPPFGHPTRLRTLIEASVLEQSEVYGGGGAIDILIRIAPAEIVRATQAETVNVVSVPAALASGDAHDQGQTA